MRAHLLASAFILASAAAGAQTLPVADAGDDQSFPCAPASGAVVTLDGTGSSDPDDVNAVLTYTWSGDSALGVGVTVDGASPIVTIPPGVHVLTLTVDDGVDGTAADTVQVTVVADVTAPVLTLGPTSQELWPPNHKYHAIEAADFVATASDECDVATGPEDVVFASGTSDEEENGRGDGNTTADLVFEGGCGTAMVRSERMGPEDGRVYELTLSLRDAAGNAAEGVVTVVVPHDRAHDPVDSGDAYTVVAEECGPVELCEPVPAEVCPAPAEAQVAMKAPGRKGDASLRWRARDFAAAAGAFDDPAVDYQLCVYTDAATDALVTDPTAPRGSLWKRKDGRASYRASKGSAGIRRLELAEKDGSGALSVDVSSEELPALPIAADTALVLQLVGSDGFCAGSSFAAPKRNDADRYLAEVPAD
jgi:hypothetical protein